MITEPKVTKEHLDNYVECFYEGRLLPGCWRASLQTVCVLTRDLVLAAHRHALHQENRKLWT